MRKTKMEKGLPLTPFVAFVGMIAMLLFSVPMAAAPIATSEADFGGDFSHINGFEANVGALDIGLNTITGRIGSDDPGDDFTFLLGSGLSIVSTTITIGNLSALDQGPAGGFAVIFEPVPMVTNFDNVTFGSDGAYALSLPDVHPGVFEVNLEGRPSVLSSTYDWKVDIGVAPIPEPSAALVFGAGLLVVRATRRRQRGTR